METVNGSSHATYYFFSLLSFFLDVSIDKYNDTIGDMIGNIFNGSNLNEEAVCSVMDLIAVLGSTKINFNMSEDLIKWTCQAVAKFIYNDSLCLKVFKAVLTQLGGKESKINK